jgi:uncharacterized FAD-dependent dehydrogenase
VYEHFKHLAELLVELDSKSAGSLIKKAALYATEVKPYPSAFESAIHHETERVNLYV